MIIYSISGHMAEVSRIAGTDLVMVSYLTRKERDQVFDERADTLRRQSSMVEAVGQKRLKKEIEIGLDRDQYGNLFLTEHELRKQLRQAGVVDDSELS